MELPLKKLNILVILAGVALIALGYLLMSGEQFIDAKEFSMALNVSPILIIFGHFVVIAGIVFRFGKKKEQANA